MLAIGASVACGFFVFFALRTSDVFMYADERSGQIAKNDTAVLPPPPPPPPPPVHIKTPVPVKAAYMTSWVAGTPSLRDGLVEFIEKSEINSIVIDIKDYSGRVAFTIDDPVVREFGAQEARIRDIRQFIDRLHQKNIYVIGRITVFQDPYITKKKPEWAVTSSKGGAWKDRKGLTYVDPTVQPFWDYIVRITRASEKIGFDELNFDYIRYPSDGPLAQAVFKNLSADVTKADALENFFISLRKELADLPVPISADLFGLATYVEDDMNIGQVLERAAPHFDYIAPMVYPSHYAPGFNGFKNPAEHPYEVVAVSMTRAVERMKTINEDPKKLRPWIQDFDLGTPYGVKEIEKQKKAIYDAGLDSWMSWDPSNKYTKAAYMAPVDMHNTRENP